jgi:nitrite reductase/ring-hydroxylating ferredoxin subunit
MKWYKVAEVGDIAAPVSKINAGGKKLCLVNNDDRFFALGSKCPHAGADLTNGWCENKKLVCPFHRYSYDLETGRGSSGQNDFVHTYPVEIRNNDIYVGVPSLWDKLKGI